MKLLTSSLSLLLLSILCSALGAEELRVGALISDAMVLSQNEENWIGGEARAGTDVRVQLGKQQPMQAVADAEGRWSVRLNPGEASGVGRTLRISSADETLEFKDVVVGELWLCSGQSNMVWSVDGSDRAQEFKAEADLPTLRMFTVANRSEEREQSDVSGRWVVCSPQTVGGFSAVGYHFGRELTEALDVPIGLVNASWGGSRVEAWMRREALAEVGPCGEGWVDRWDEAQRALYSDPGQYADPEVDDSEWLRGKIPGHVNAFGVEDDVDGLFWHRVALNIPAEWAGKTLVVSLGKIDDHDVTYFNGVEIGRTNGWQTPRRYEIPGSLVSGGEAVLAIRCLDGAGPGGIHGEEAELFIHPKGESQEKRSLAGPARMTVASNARDMPAQHRPSHLYNGMFAPLGHLCFSGVLWYQGENNAIDEGDPECYEVLLRGMLADWRDALGNSTLPFYIVQLPNFRHAPSWDYARVRDAQRRVAAADPNAGLAITMDVGQANDIHPRNKHDVGNRLARLALPEVYGVDAGTKSGPVPTKVYNLERVAPSNNSAQAVAIEFETFGSELTSPEEDGSVGGFELAGRNGVFKNVNGVIENGRVVLEAPGGMSPRLVRYAWAGEPEGANLGNHAGLPASPFEMSVPVGRGQKENKGDVMLIFSKTAGFRHGSIPAGVKCFKKIAQELGLKAIATEDSSQFNDETLKKCAVVVFLNTTGDVLDSKQEAALEKYVKSGGGWVGVHSAADTEYDWPFYGELVGAYFKTHPRIQEAVIQVEDRDHPSTRMLPGLWRRTDEWYVYRLSPRPHVRVLASLDETSYTGGGMDGDHPIAWCHDVEKGRALYTGGGHTDESFVEPKFVEHLRGAVIWAAGMPAESE